MCGIVSRRTGPWPAPGHRAQVTVSTESTDDGRLLCGKGLLPRTCHHPPLPVCKPGVALYVFRVLVKHRKVKRQTQEIPKSLDRCVMFPRGGARRRGASTPRIHCNPNRNSNRIGAPGSPWKNYQVTKN